jgi:hypothetical protein
MPLNVLTDRPATVPAAARRVLAACLAATLCTACGLFESPPPPPPPHRAPPPAPVAAPAPPAVLVAPADLAKPADQVARRLLAYHEQIRLLSPTELAAEIARLDATLAPGVTTSPPDILLDLSLALALQHNPGDLARAGSLLDPLTQAADPDLLPWQGIARLLAGRIAEQRRLEEQAERQASQWRDSQRTNQQLTEKLEALKAIERSMIKRPAGPGTPAETPSGGR